MKPSEFLQTLWGSPPPGRLQLWRLEDRKAFYPLSVLGADQHGGRPDVFTCVALCWERADLQPRRRPSAQHAVALAGLWLDIDHQGDDALAIATALAEPTLLVHSGHGLHAWHLFETPWRFTSGDDQKAAAVMAAQWQQLHRAAAAERGLTLDHTHDLARLMRLPGTVNAKAAPVPVTVSGRRGPRHAREDLAAAAAAAGPVSLHTPGGAQGVGGVRVQLGGTLDPVRLELLLEDPELGATFRHERGAAGWSLSEYDMSLASQLVAAGGWSDQDIADVLVAHRAHHGERVKAQRAGYLERTIARARAGSERHEAAARIAALRRRPTRLEAA